MNGMKLVEIIGATVIWGLLLLVNVPGLLAQTAPTCTAGQVCFGASPDHALLSAGKDVVTTYALDLYFADSIATRRHSLTLQKGTPDKEGVIRQVFPKVDVPVALYNRELVANLRAIGPGGASNPTPNSLPFVLMGQPQSPTTAPVIIP